MKPERRDILLPEPTTTQNYLADCPHNYIQKGCCRVREEVHHNTGITRMSRESENALQAAVLAVLLLLLLSLPAGDGLRCINCTSLRDAGCLEGVGSEQQCTESQNYCVSYTGYLKKGQAQVLFRACTETNMSQFCGVHFEKLTNNRVARLIACYRTCSTDLCNVHRMEYINHAPSIAFCLSPLATVLLAAILTLLLRFIIET
ncbi:uncharacterized protein [Panulirus ornatus]|uniref:uncharacterized protein n=1 Tax=Panulirus ornatus TaxID=150431 RepID=UPI003A84F97A